MKHQYHKCNKNDCFICEGGLLYCEVCHLGEVELVSDECSGGLTPLALDGAIAPDNQQVLPADVLVGEGTLPEPPRQ